MMANRPKTCSWLAASDRARATTAAAPIRRGVSMLAHQQLAPAKAPGSAPGSAPRSGSAQHVQPVAPHPPAANAAAFLALQQLALRQSLELEDHIELPWRPGAVDEHAAAVPAASMASWESAAADLTLAGVGQCFVAHIEALHPRRCRGTSGGSLSSMDGSALAGEGSLLDRHSILDDTVSDDGDSEWCERAARGR
ncbi:hypothetical protein FOA52_000617 [Chlamydomonas sp. UWO 241]|nr:hypothetical protein FOA52_000617 [Chlamydomonas sp. UWO 241]